MGLAKQTREERNQAILDQFYLDHGPCCAGCDWWRWHNSVAGECIRTVPVASHDRYAMLGIRGASFPIKAGHGCIGCSEDGFWDKGSFYDRLTTIHQFGIEGTADQIGGGTAAVVGAAVAAHAAVSAIKRASSRDSATTDH